LRAIIFANGGTTQLPDLQPDDLIIAADGGARHCLAYGLVPHLVVGDFDSLDDERLVQLRKRGVEMIQYPVRKDYTDLELALHHAMQRGAHKILVLAALGGRWDQTLANVLLPAAKEFAALDICLIDGAQEIRLFHAGQRMQINGCPGDTVSLVPLNGDAQGITTENLEYPLHAETLYFGSTRGISNVMTTNTATVYLDNGALLCVVIHQQELVKE
jgi:thiamine pyrophosphokinase